MNKDSRQQPSKPKTSMRVGLGRFHSNLHVSPPSSAMMSPPLIPKKSLFKPWTESTPKCRQTDIASHDDVNLTPGQRSRREDIFGSHYNTETENVLACSSLSPAQSITHNRSFVRASQTMRDRNLGFSNSAKMLSMDESIFGSLDLAKIDAISHTSISESPDGLVREQGSCSDKNEGNSNEMLSINESIFSSINLEEINTVCNSTSDKTPNSFKQSRSLVRECEESLEKKQKIIHEISTQQDMFATAANDVDTDEVHNSITQNLTPSIMPMGEALRLAFIKNAGQPVCPKVLPVRPFNIEMSPQSTNTGTKASGPECFQALGPFFGLPSKVKHLIRDLKGITELYAWQTECLNLPALKERQNLIYALPTSGGKTLVAEILIIREVLCRKKNVIFVLPYVSIVQEKVRALSSFAIALDFLVEEYAAGKGLYPPRKRRWKQSVFICTIEKALGLVNSLIEQRRLSEVGLVVVDELHLIGDNSGRGANLEGLLTKLMFAPETVQIVGMSATIGNIQEIAQFLNAETYKQDFRPVELIEYVKLEDSIYLVNSNSNSDDDVVTFHKKLEFEFSAAMRKIDPDMISALVSEVIPDNSCLVFCPTRQNCENVGVLLSRLLHPALLEHKKAEKVALYKALQLQANGSVCPVLTQTLPFGVAYHHSGLTGDERRLIEEAYLSTTICCICCTSTLAAGVNLPAKRVILRSPYVGRDFISLSKYKQMVGRAGRAGMGDLGESFLMCDKMDVSRVRKLLLSTMDDSDSSLHLDSNRGMRNLLLSAIGLSIATTRLDIHRLVKSSLLYVQSDKLTVDVKKMADQTVDSLFKSGAVQTTDPSPDTSVLDINISVRMSDDVETQQLAEIADFNRVGSDSTNEKRTVFLRPDTELTLSRLGRAAMSGSIELSVARMLYEDMREMQAAFVCLSHLHLLYLVTPYDSVDRITPNKTVYFSALQELDKKDVRTARVLGLDEAAMASLMSGQRVKGLERRINRFYVTLMLNELWHERSTWEVSMRYQISRGIVQALMTSASSFASCVLRFCEVLEEMWVFRDLLGSFTQRLAHCCSVELLPLMQLPAVKRGRAKQLYHAGYRTVMDVAKANPSNLVRDIEPMSRRIASQIIAAAKMSLMEKVETLREEAADALEVLALDKSIPLV